MQTVTESNFGQILYRSGKPENTWKKLSKIYRNNFGPSPPTFPAVNTHEKTLRTNAKTHKKKKKFLFEAKKEKKKSIYS